ncbi:MAG: bifunctional folylpolyglutamate synthase/dihydrofolate synthase [Flavobacteriaceae bacterium]|nr:bifunctional folylpolyglutamate synthase/dihydrofolate synthase [Flavobacteriaceae bacterium]
MKYEEITAWMFSRLPMYQQQGGVAYKKDLSRTELFAAHLGHPENKFKSIHVGGTNGKGSTAHMLAAVLQEARHKVGLYTSPHLKDFRERIKINDTQISENFVIDFIKENKLFLERHQLSFFEMTVGMAFSYFEKQNVDIAVIEVGLGGRLDSTNIITPEVSVITNIGMDHTQFLGETLKEIATEKAGIIKVNVPVVIGETQDEIQSVFSDKAKTVNADLFFADASEHQVFPCSLLGEYQQKNIKTALQTLSVLKTKGLTVKEQHIKKGLMQVQKHTGLRGRWEILSEHPKVICDVAHNKEGLTLVLKQLQKESYKTLHIVLGMVRDKAVEDLVELFPKQAVYYFCSPALDRGMKVNKLAQIFNANGYQGQTYSSVNEALSSAKQLATPQDLIFVGGSTFVVAEVL